MPLKPKFHVGDKVEAINKTVGSRDFDNCATYYRRLALNQPFLYVRGLNATETVNRGIPVYWCDVVNGCGLGGDLYSECDLVAFKA